MNLMDLFYPPFVPPKVIRKFTHKIGFEGQPRYVAPKKPPKEERDPDALTPSEEKAYHVLWRKGVPMSSFELAPLIEMSRNHAGVILASLHKKGKLSRVQYRKPGIRFFRYTVKEEE